MSEYHKLLSSFTLFFSHLATNGFFNVELTQPFRLKLQENMKNYCSTEIFSNLSTTLGTTLFRSSELFEARSVFALNLFSAGFDLVLF